MRRWLIALATLALVVFLFILCIYGLWLNRLRVAEQAFAESRYQDAGSQFRAARSAWELKLLPAWLVEEHLVRIVLNVVQAAYAQEKYQEALDFLKGEGALPALGDRAEFHFWVANLLMQQMLRGSSSNLLETLVECRGEYLESMRRAPDFWDAKYNYEYVNSLLARLQKEEDQQEPDIKILLEHMRTDQQRRRKELPLQKRG